MCIIFNLRRLKGRYFYETPTKNLFQIGLSRTQPKHEVMVKKMFHANTIPTKRNDLVDAFFSNYRKNSSSKVAIDFFQDKQLLSSFLNEIIGFTSKYHLADYFAETVGQFSLKTGESLNKYFKKELSLNQICNEYARFIFENELLFSADSIKKASKKMRDFTDNTVNGFVKSESKFKVC